MLHDDLGCAWVPPLVFAHLMFVTDSFGGARYTTRSLTAHWCVQDCAPRHGNGLCRRRGRLRRGKAMPGITAVQALATICK